eukprot:CAMPEP_0177786720 /NCGR_PEP_ID=MMETSP0491_2-20121128/21082_1 /TAXON_ID=63592 /ORGANISM="Tetraselmis chuii, Strain PLY429" /LENGTH=44 /DNA_ID= /DNA_START= /DNA_END= /DNA_ORIENTATION=
MTALIVRHVCEVGVKSLWEAQGGEACDRVPGKIDGIKLNVSQRV